MTTAGGLGDEMTVAVALTVNGMRREMRIPVTHTLLDLLRARLGLTGTKESCLEGCCGACTVLLDNRPVMSCLVLGASVDGHDVVTIEGVAPKDGLHPLQQAFLTHAAAQCGYCTSGMILSAKALLDRTPAPSDQEIRRALHGNLCRCTGYNAIIEAVKHAGRLMRERPAATSQYPAESHR